MSDTKPTTLETDDRFPSGPWSGYYIQRSFKGKMELHLSFINGRVMGTGRDPIGPFSIIGHYDIEDGKVWWTKKYASHDVFYQGFAEGQGIWGTWEIPRFDREGFRIWPKGIADAIERREREETRPSRITFDDEPLESDTLCGTSEKETVLVP